MQNDENVLKKLLESKNKNLEFLKIFYKIEIKNNELISIFSNLDKYLRNRTFI
jgi:hypothetical protein